MVDKPKKESGGRGQHDRFIEAARQLGADEDEGAFKTKLALIARQKPKVDVLEQQPTDEREDV